MMEDQEFVKFPKIPRANRAMVITEKLDGTNAQVVISGDGKEIRAGSRNRWIKVGDDNYGFAAWVEDNKEELLKLGPGRHFGEWWGLGIQRRYNIGEKRFSLFNTARWDDSNCPSCCSVVPVLYTGPFDIAKVNEVVSSLAKSGSIASPGFEDPEGVVVYLAATRGYMKVTCKNDGVPKGSLV